MTDRAHLSFVRAQGCVVRSKAADRCFGPIEAHHVRTAANSGMGMKPSDRSAVGLCVRHHRALHTNGRRSFEARHGVDLAAEAARLALENPATPHSTPQPPTEGHPPMSDTTALPDAAMELLRQRETELVLEVRDRSERLDELRALITRLTPPRSRAQRRLRTPEERIAAPGPEPLAVSLEGALDRLGTAVHARDAELADAA